MREPQQQQTLLDDDATLVVSGEETTLVSPRFDDEETLVARPVVPLEAEGIEAAPARTAVRVEPVYSRPYAPRRRGMLGLVLVSVLVGGVLGGAGLYLYQRQSQDPAVNPNAVTQPAAPADAAQAPAQPAAAEARHTTQTEAPAQQPATPAASETNAEEPAPNAPDTEVPAAAPAREPESVPAAERRAAPADTGTPKRGKKGERDEEIERRAAPPTNGNVARAAEPEARQVDSIFYRQRRAERRAERRARRNGDIDRLRRIFEGTPQ
jgi:hypothetical protein